MQAGERVRAAGVATLAALGIANVRARAARVLIAPIGEDPILIAAAEFIRRDLQNRCCNIECHIGLDEALARPSADFVILIGGTGSGANDASIAGLAHAARVAVHGIALSPGETSGFGFVEHRPVLLLPGRLDAAIAGWLMLGRFALDRLSGAREQSERSETLPLARKIASTVGLTELIPVRRDGRRSRAARSTLLGFVGDRARRWLCCCPAGERRFFRRRGRSGMGAPMSEADVWPKNDLLARVRAAARQEQFLEVVSAEEAQARFARAIDLTPLEAETVALTDALGRVLAHDVVAAVDAPPFDRANVDGFAIRASDTDGASDSAPEDAQPE